MIKVMKTSRWARVLARVAAAVAAILIVLPIVLGVFVAGAIRTVAPPVLGVPVKVKWVSLSFLRGRVGVRGFEIGNPEGFSTPYLLHADEVAVELSVRELLGGTCHIREIRVIGPHVWYHRKLAESNVSALLADLDRRFPKDKDGDKPREAKPAKKEKKGGSMPVMIDHFLFDEGTVGIKVGAGVEVPLAKVELNDIGKDGAFMPVQIVRVILGAVFDSVLHAVEAVGGLAVDAVETIGGAAVDAVGAAAGAVGDAAGAIFKGAKSILGGD